MLLVFYMGLSSIIKEKRLPAEVGIDYTFIIFHPYAREAIDLVGILGRKYFPIPRKSGKMMEYVKIPNGWCRYLRRPYIIYVRKNWCSRRILSGGRWQTHQRHFRKPCKSHRNSFNAGSKCRKTINHGDLLFNWANHPGKTFYAFPKNLRSVPISTFLYVKP